ncbi:MAG: hypothetical protein IT323_03235, partial [Anaerolineae bacterium]|nr:hypothetical protein [Anaerolineae bacterium]
MSSEQDTLVLIAHHLARAVEPLKRAVADLDSFKAFMFRLGWDPQSMPPAYANLANSVTAVITAVESLAGGDIDPREIINAIEAVGGLYDAIDAISAAPAGVDPGPFLAETGKSLFELLLADYMQGLLP